MAIPEKIRPTNQVELSSPRLLLRAARPEDADDLHGAFRDPEVMKYWSTLPHATLADTSAWVHGMIDAPCNGVTDFIVCAKPGLKPIGKAGVWRDGEIGFLLSRTCWGMGLGKEVVSLVLDHLFFSRDDWDEIVADVDPRNDACLKLLGGLGFEVYDRRERTFEIGGVWVDSLYLRLKRETWIGRSKR